MTAIARFGASQLRIEDDRFLTGAGRYIDDIVLPDMAHAVLVRSDRGHARIRSLDVAHARAADGVLLVVTGPEWAAAGYKPIPTKNPVRKFRDGRPFAEPARHCLAVDTVRHVGEPVVLVVAETREQAVAASELVSINYDDLDAVVHQSAAIEPAAPELWQVAPGNICVDFELGNRAEVEAAFASADHVVTLEVVNNRVLSVPMEPRGCIGQWDAANGSATIWNSSQNIHANRDVFADMLGLDKAKLRHLAPDVGGGFGAKNCLYPEPPLLVHASRLIGGRPVKWVATRTESFTSDAHGRDQVSTVSLALDNDGTFRALKVATNGNIGACCGTMGAFTPTNGSARTQGGPYAFKAMLYEATAVFTNTVQTDPYRGAGRPEASFHIERIVEHAARTLGFDPIALRRQNLIPTSALPWKTPMGLLVDSGNFQRVLDDTLKLAGHDSLATRKAAAKAKGKRIGFAIAPYLECSGGQPTEEARVTFRADGTVGLAVGSQSTGMGHETALSQILSARLGIPLARIRYAQADTALTRIGGGHGGSRGIELGGNAVMKAADTIEGKVRVIAAHLLNSRADDMEFADGVARDRTTGQSVTIAEVIRAAGDPARLPAAIGVAADASALDTTEVYERQQITIPNGCHAAEVEVDPETGFVKVVGFWAVDDFGRIVNPMLADGQVMGGIAQGLGQALFEQVVYEPGSGQLLTASFMDYTMPRADDMPPLDIAYFEDAPTTHNPIGSKGAGEAGCCGAPPAIVNAVIDALAEWGVTHIDMPVTPEKVWRAINGR
ncbi:MAG: xanthine dehydrogenase family protein molybdopterin-binding subunit [Hyphomicrobiaceae bacterium]